MITTENELNAPRSNGKEDKSSRVDRVHVHKLSDENVFIGDIERVYDEMSTNGKGSVEGLFRAPVVVNLAHPFFFERDRGHVTGLYLIEAGRQMGIAVPHLFYGVTMDNEFILDEMSVKFHGFASLSSEIIVVAGISNTKWRGKRLASATFGGEMVQAGKKILNFSANITIMPNKLVKRLETKVTREAAVESFA